jgi:hypothetical protein
MNKKQKTEMKLAQLEYIEEQIHSFFELFCDFVDEFDGSEYQQGKKDGMRIALSFISDPSWADLNRGGRMGREIRHTIQGEKGKI